jgi:hypothetical protein
VRRAFIRRGRTRVRQNSSEGAILLIHESGTEQTEIGFIVQPE